MFEHTAKYNQLDLNHQEKLHLHLSQLRKMVTHIKVTCEASTRDS